MSYQSIPAYPGAPQAGFQPVYGAQPVAYATPVYATPVQYQGVPAVAVPIDNAGYAAATVVAADIDTARILNKARRNIGCAMVLMLACAVMAFWSLAATWIDIELPANSLYAPTNLPLVKIGLLDSYACQELYGTGAPCSISSDYVKYSNSNLPPVDGSADNSVLVNSGRTSFGLLIVTGLIAVAGIAAVSRVSRLVRAADESALSLSSPGTSSSLLWLANPASSVRAFWFIFLLGTAGWAYFLDRNKHLVDGALLTERWSLGLGLGIAITVTSFMGVIVMGTARRNIDSARSVATAAASSTSMWWL